MSTTHTRPSENAKLVPFESFLGRDSHRRQIPTRPQQETCPDEGEPVPLSVAAGFWLVMVAVGIPVLIGYVGIIRWLWRHL